MTEQALRKMIAAGESTRQEFKSWVKCKDYRQRKDLAVKSAVALANTKGGVLLFGVEDDGTITGCPKSDPQALILDTRQAVKELTQQGIHSHCISLDPNADAYVRDIFGHHFTVIDRVERLPERLPRLFMALTR